MENTAVGTVSNTHAPSAKITGILQRYPVILQLCRFVAIGVLNTALDFLILNFISKTLAITSGIQLGGLNVVGFSAAVIQSYFWNRYWAFGEQESGIFKNFIRLVLVGFLGFMGMVTVLLGAAAGAQGVFYLVMLIAYIIFQVALWKGFGLGKQGAVNVPAAAQFWNFLIVSIVGLVINSGLVAVLSGIVNIGSEDLTKNIAKILATVISLVWNFIGYKLIVFKR